MLNITQQDLVKITDMTSARKMLGRTRRELEYAIYQKHIVEPIRLGRHCLLTMAMVKELERYWASRGMYDTRL